MSDIYVVVGAGIVGLYTVYSLIEKGVPPSQITVKAQYHSGDQSVNFTSPWAGANFSCISPDDDATLKYDKFSYTHLETIRQKLGGVARGLDMLPATEYWDYTPPAKKIASLKTYLKDFKEIAKEKLPAGAHYGITYTTWNFNVPVYLENMTRYLSSRGVHFERVTLAHINEAFASPDTKAVFNCSGIGAHRLPGVEDKKVYPLRGQVVAIKAPHIRENMLRWGRENVTYIIPRSHPGAEVVLGGFVQKDNWSADTYRRETEDILKRTTEFFPKILEQPLEVLKVTSGLRPTREGGTRIEKEIVSGGKVLIHNYGASGYGYQSGYGMATHATDLLFSTNAKL